MRNPEVTTSNRVVHEKKLTIKSENWLYELWMSPGVLLGPPNRTTPRTGQQTTQKQLEVIIACIQNSGMPVRQKRNSTLHSNQATAE
jgi:hypothetical protein